MLKMSAAGLVCRRCVHRPIYSSQTGSMTLSQPVAQPSTSLTLSLLPYTVSTQQHVVDAAANIAAFDVSHAQCHNTSVFTIPLADQDAVTNLQMPYSSQTVRTNVSFCLLVCTLDISLYIRPLALANILYVRCLQHSHVLDTLCLTSMISSLQFCLQRDLTHLTQTAKILQTPSARSQSESRAVNTFCSGQQSALQTMKDYPCQMQLIYSTSTMPWEATPPRGTIHFLAAMIPEPN